MEAAGAISCAVGWCRQRVLFALSTAATGSGCRPRDDADARSVGGRLPAGADQADKIKGQRARQGFSRAGEARKSTSLLWWRLLHIRHGYRGSSCLPCWSDTAGLATFPSSSGQFGAIEFYSSTLASRRNRALIFDNDGAILAAPHQKVRRRRWAADGREVTWVPLITAYRSAVQRPSLAALQPSRVSR